MISTVDLTRRGLLRIIGYLEVTDLPAPERFNAAINDLVDWVQQHPEDLDRFFAETPASYPKWETDATLAAVSGLNRVISEAAHQVARNTAPIKVAPITQETTPIDLADYGHAGFRREVSTTPDLLASEYGDWHNDPHHNDLP